MTSRRESAHALGQRLCEKRQARGLTQGQLAVRLGVTRQAISKWEHGQSQPDLDNLKQLAEVYSCSVDELLGATGHPGSPFEANDANALAAMTPSEGARIMRDRSLVWKHALLSGGVLGLELALINALHETFDPMTSPPIMLVFCGIALLCGVKLFSYTVEYRRRGGSTVLAVLELALVLLGLVAPLALGATPTAMAICSLLGLTCVFCANRIFAWQLLYQRPWNPREDFRDPLGRRNHTLR